MKKIIIDIPIEIYERALKLAEKMNISFDELCEQGVRKLAEEYLEDKENENH